MPFRISLELLSTTLSTDGSRRNLSFVAKGPDHMVLYFNDTVLEWPFLDHVPDAENSGGEHFVFFASSGDRDAIVQRFVARAVQDRLLTSVYHKSTCLTYFFNHL